MNHPVLHSAMFQRPQRCPKCHCNCIPCSKYWMPLQRNVKRRAKQKARILLVHRICLPCTMTNKATSSNEVKSGSVMAAPPRSAGCGVVLRNCTSGSAASTASQISAKKKKRANQKGQTPKGIGRKQAGASGGDVSLQTCASSGDAETHANAPVHSSLRCGRARAPAAARMAWRRSRPG